MLNEQVSVEPNERGRPSSYKPEFAKQAEKLCELGATDADLADFFGVAIRTVERWRKEKEDFCRAVTIGKDIADNNVERSLYQRAVGYTFDSEKVFQYQGQIVRAQVREHVPPDTASAIFWLKNRRKEQWRDKSEQDVNHKLGLSEEFEQFIRQMTSERPTHVIEHQVGDAAE